MALKIGLVGLPNAGKSTLFNALTGSQVSAENYPFCTIDPNIGVVVVPDKRLDRLKEIYQPKKVTPTTIEFVDIAGLVKGASRGEGLGNKFLAHIREVDAIAHVVRCFENGDVSHVENNVDPIRDIEIIKTELCLADIETIEKRYEKTERLLKTGDSKYKDELVRLKKFKEELNRGIMINQMDLNEREEKLVSELFLLTAKPVLYIANISEGQSPEKNEFFKRVEEYAKDESSEVIAVSCRIEADLALLPEKEAEMFLKEFGIENWGLDNLIQKSYHTLNLITFFTGNENELRAWTIKEGTTALEAAGKIHTDMQRGFIRAEVINFFDLEEYNSLLEAREEGKIRIEGKEYVVKDGDVCYFRFNV